MSQRQKPDRVTRQLELPLPALPLFAPRRAGSSDAPPASHPSDPAASAAPGRARRARHSPRAENPRQGEPLSPVTAYRRLDERTRRIGLEGIAAARALLERGQPPERGSEQTCAGPRRAA